MKEIVEKNLEACFTITLEEQIMMIQHSDPELRHLIQIFRKDQCDRTVGEQNIINDYSYKGGRLFRMVKNGEKERALYVIHKTTGIEDPRRKDWDLKIKEVERDLNNAVNKTTNKTPFETLHGYSPRFHDGILRRLADEDMDPWTEPERIQESVRTQIENKQEIMKTYYDKKKCRTLQFDITRLMIVKRKLKLYRECFFYKNRNLFSKRNSDISNFEDEGSRVDKAPAREEDDSATEESPDEESEEEDTLRRNPRRSCNARISCAGVLVDW
ncbi:hypothetical protein LAZ67_19001597 [Cordylochernes scorpioides]|uniref:Uncharacterized protein n=1 Tax=Cordylochernes scorpioides TaxID=51811 RepID=A0ABY6LK25_9ARAC|nr:hypothetical protein LAZ67_19001597 [Cordylochernes scorpioides]